MHAKPGMFRTAVLFIAFAAACSDKKSSELSTETAQPSAQAPTAPAQTASASPADEARQTFSTLCVTCHGTDGKGDGPAAANLNPKPRNYTDKAWQASVTDDQLAKVILEGGAAVGKSPLMPPNPQFKDKPQVIAELVKIVRGFGQ